MITDRSLWLVDITPFVYVIGIISLIIGFMLGISLYEKKKIQVIVCIVLCALAFLSEYICHAGIPCSPFNNDGYDRARDMAFFAELIFLPCAIGCIGGCILTKIILKEEDH